MKNKILNNQEKEILRTVLEPFKGHIECVFKDEIEYSGDPYVVYEVIEFYSNDGWLFEPFMFKKNKMFKNMKLFEQYTIEELELYD